MAHGRDVALALQQLSIAKEVFEELKAIDEDILGVYRFRSRSGSSIEIYWGALRFFARDSAGEWDRVGSHFLQTLAAGSSATVETTFEAPSVAGDYLYAACLASSHVEFSCVSESLAVVSTSALEPR